MPPRTSPTSTAAGQTGLIDATRSARAALGAAGAISGRRLTHSMMTVTYPAAVRMPGTTPAMNRLPIEVSVSTP